MRHAMLVVMRTVDRDELEREPERWLKIAETEPVTITKGGEPQSVMLARDEYERLRRRDIQARAAEKAMRGDASEDGDVR